MSLLLELLSENFATARADIEQALKKSFKQVGTVLNRVTLSDVTLNDDGTVSVKGDVILPENSKLKRLPVRFKDLTGKFDCSHTSLETLEGGPERVQSFDCSETKIKNFVGAPRVINTWLVAHNNDLDSLEGLEETRINGNTSLDGSKLRSLKGAPKFIGGFFKFNAEELKNLEHLPKKIGALAGGKLHINGVRKNLPLLRVFLSDINAPTDRRVHLFDIKESAMTDVESIINKHLKAGRAGASPASSELIDNGYMEHARA